MEPKKPAWISTKIDLTSFESLISKIERANLHVVCFEASCPNIGTCFQEGTATFLILGNICTRNCAFCGIKHGNPLDPDADEPREISKLVSELNLRHVVITSVTRDDLPDQGVKQFIKTIRAIRNSCKNTTIEVLIPDFQGNKQLLNTLLEERPDILNHNVETVPRLYPVIRPQAVYSRSISLLKYIKEQFPTVYTKTGFMVGLGETEDEIFSLINHLRDAKCDILTIGQYLRPSGVHVPVKKYYSPEEFQKYEAYGKTLGFQSIMAAPLVRSSYNAKSFSMQFIK